MKKCKIICSNSKLKSFFAVLDKVNETSRDLFSSNVIIVPDKFTMNAERLFFEYLKKQSTLNVQVMSLTYLVRKICKNIENQYEMLNQNSAIMLITKILLDNKDKFGLIKNIKSKSIANEFYNTIMQFKSSGVKPEEVLSKTQNQNFDLKLKDIQFVYSEYEKIIKNKKLDSANLIDYFVEKVKNDAFINQTNFFVAYFDNFSFKQMEGIVAVAKYAKSFNIGLACNTLQPNKSIFINETLQQLIEQFQNNKIDYEIENCFNKVSNDFDVLGQNFYAPLSKQFQTKGQIELIEAENSEQEIDFVAREIKKLVVNQECNFNDINIACGDFNQHKDLIKKTFENYTLPFYFDYSLPLTETYFGKFVLNFLKMFETNFEKQYVLEFISSKFFKHYLLSQKFKQTIINLSSAKQTNFLKEQNSLLQEQSIFDKYNANFEQNNKNYEEINKNLHCEQIVLEQTKDEQEIIEQNIFDFKNYCLEFGINHTSFFKEFLNHNANEIRTHFVNVIQEIIKEFENNKTIDENLKSLLLFFDKINAKQILNNLLLNNNYDIDFKKSTQQVFEKFENLLKQISVVLGENECDLEYFIVLLENTMNNVNVSTVPLGVNRIFVGDFSNTMFYPSKYMFVVGAVDGVIPNYKTDCGLITDDEIDNLNSKNILSPSIRFVNKVEKFKTFENLRLSSEKLYVSYASLTFGQQSKPSEIFQEFKKIFKNEDGELTTFKIANEYQNLKLCNASYKDYVESFASKENLRNLLSKQEKDDLLYSAQKVFAQERYCKNGNNVLKIQNQLNNKFNKQCCDEQTISKKSVIAEQVLPIKQNYQSEQDFSFEQNESINKNSFNPQENLSKQINFEKLFFPKKTVSVSQIQTYFSCPYKHFATYGLRLKERKIYGLKPLDIGNFLHLVAEKYVSLLIKNNYISTPKDIDNIINFCVNEILKDNQNIVEKFKQDSLVKEAKNLCNNIKKHINSSEFKPTFAEKKFIYALKNDSLSIIGKVDRIDQNGNLFITYDYKTGKSVFDFKDIYYGTNIQIVLYSSLLESILNLVSVGEFYIPIKNKFIEENTSNYFSGILTGGLDILNLLDKEIEEEKTSEFYKVKFNKNGSLDKRLQSTMLSPNEYKSIKKYCEDVLIKALGEIKQGYIEPKPNEDACKYCPYSTMCGFNKEEQGTRKSKAKAKTTFENLYSNLVQNKKE